MDGNLMQAPLSSAEWEVSRNSLNVCLVIKQNTKLESNKPVTPALHGFTRHQIRLSTYHSLLVGPSQLAVKGANGQPHLYSQGSRK